jgi:heptosyltransferase-2
MKIAVLCPNWVGDLVMATPALRAVRGHYPAAEIVAVLRPFLSDVLAGTTLVDRTIGYHPRGTQADERGWRIVQKLRQERFDLALVLPNSLRTGWLAWISGAKRRVGFARNGRGWMLTDAVQPRSRKTPHPVLDEYLRLAAHLGCTDLAPRMELATTPIDEERLDRYWKQQGVSRPGGVICLNSGGAFGAAKHWPVASFAELARKIAWKLDRRVLVLCGPAERELAREIVRLADFPAVTSLADEPPSLGLTKAAVRRAELLVTTDSGPRHFAQPFGVPVVTLFGPTHQEWSETNYERSVHLQEKLDCGPCQKRTCPLGHHRCMTELSVERVFRAVTYLLDAQAGQRRAA